MGEGTSGTKVHIYFNNENGEWVWAIQKHEDREDWLDSCDTYDQAAAYCEAMEWVVVSTSSADRWEGDGGDTFDAPHCPYCGTENKEGKGLMTCRACSRVFCSFEIPTGMVVYCTRK